MTLDNTGLYCDHTILCALRWVDVAGWKRLPRSLVELSEKFSLSLLLGLLASRVVSAYYYWKLTGEGVRTGGGFHTYPKTIRQLPVFDVRKATPKHRESAAEIENLAGRLLAMHEALDVAKTPHECTALRRQIDATDRRIDELVYEVYGLTRDEIAIIESAEKTPSIENSGVTELTRDLDR